MPDNREPNEIPRHPRKYFTVYYQCDNLIDNCDELIQRLINDQDGEDGLLRLVPNDGKELIEFARTKEVEGGQDLKVVKWGAKGIETSKYVKTVCQFQKLISVKCIDFIEIEIDF